MSMPAYSVNTERLLLRCFEFKDAYEMKSAIDASKEHLVKWMAWAEQEPEELDKKIERIRGRRIEFDRDENYHYAVFLQDSERFIGSISLMKRIGEGAMEIGYWMHVDYINKGYMSEAASALVKIAFELYKVERVEVHCDIENLRSAAIPKKLGFNHEATVRANEINEDGSRKLDMIWVLFKEEYEKLKLKDVKLKAFDAIGREIII